MIALRRLVLVGLVFLVWTPAALAWSWPVDGPVLQPFSYDVSHPYAAGQHRGIDIGANSAGESVSAPAAGTVTFAGSVPTSGNCVTIETLDGYHVTLTHLGSIGVAKGATVDEGDVVGTVGPSGTPELDRPYVHLGIRLTADPLGYVDPLGFLPDPSPPPPPASGGDAGSADSSGSGSGSGAGAPPPPASPAPAVSTASAADAPAVPADPAPATRSPEPTQVDPTATTGDSKPVAGRGRRVPAPSLSTGSKDFADLPGAADGTNDGEAATGDDAGSSSADRSSDPVGHPAGAPTEAPRHAHSRHVRGSGSPEELPAHLGKALMDAGWSPLQPRISARLPNRPSPSGATPLLSLVLGLGPGLLALTVALAVFFGRTRRRVAGSPVVEAVVVRLPGNRLQQRQERRAA